jgi:UDP-galactopyranose mutase
MLAAQRQLGRGMTVDGCATVTAIMQISKGNPNAIIRREALETEIKKMKQPGSAFLRTMADDRAREKYAELAKAEKNVLFGGRLGMYKYFDMDKDLRAALDLCAEELA